MKEKDSVKSGDKPKFGQGPRKPLKRSGFKKTGSSLKRTPFSVKPESFKPLRRTRIRAAGKSDTATVKREIQEILREGAIRRDGGCVLRHYPAAGSCGGYRKDGQLILQAEHLITRSNSATFADMRNIVCLCAHHHGNFKPQYSRIYWELMMGHLGEDRWAWLARAEADKSPHKVDMVLAKLALRQEVARMPEAELSINH